MLHIQDVDRIGRVRTLTATIYGVKNKLFGKLTRIRGQIARESQDINDDKSRSSSSTIGALQDRLGFEASQASPQAGETEMTVL